MPKNTSRKEAPAKILKMNSAPLPPDSPQPDSPSKSSMPAPMSEEESSKSFKTLLQGLSETSNSDDVQSTEASTSLVVQFTPRLESQDPVALDPVMPSQSTPPATEEMDPEEDEDLVAISDGNKERYHLLIIPPEGSPVGEACETPQEILAAIAKYTQAPVLMGEIDSWGVHVFYGRKVELVGDIRFGRIALKEGDEIHKPNDFDQLPRTLSGTFQTVEDLPISSVTESNESAAGDFSLFEDNNPLF